MHQSHAPLNAAAPDQLLNLLMLVALVVDPKCDLFLNTCVLQGDLLEQRISVERPCAAALATWQLQQLHWLTLQLGPSSQVRRRCHRSLLAQIP